MCSKIKLLLALRKSLYFDCATFSLFFVVIVTSRRKELMVICTIVGVRPQFVKAAVLSPIIRKEHKEILIHTGQHYDENMSAVFFHDLGLPEPDYILKTEGKTVQEKLDYMVRNLEPIILQAKADAILIYGDTNSTLAGAMVAEKLNIPAIHVEAGERAGLHNNPEEQIRSRVDHISSLLLCSTNQAMENLRKEGLAEKTRYIGNLMEISFQKNIEKAWHPQLVSLIDRKRVSIPGNYYLLTCHRQENSNIKCLTEIMLGMDLAKYPVIFPVHPRNKKYVLQIFTEYKLRNFILTEPVGYFESIHLIKNAVAAVTDSGGILQEAHFAQTPYVFVLEIPKPPVNTRFDVSRLVKPAREEIFKKLDVPQIFKERSEQDFSGFEDNMLNILREFENSIAG